MIRILYQHILPLKTEHLRLLKCFHDIFLDLSNDTQKTHTHRYFHFSLFYRRAHNNSVIDGLVFRAFVLCDGDSLNTDLNIIKME